MTFQVTSNKGVNITLANGYSVSIQWGRGNYGSNRDFAIWSGPVPPAALVETAVIDPDGNFIKRRRSDGDLVQGYQTPEQVIATLAWAARKKPKQVDA